MTIYRNCRIIDGTGSAPIERGYLNVRDGRILDVGTDDEGKSFGSEEQVDLSGKTIMPGMINCHAHILVEADTWDRASMFACSESAIAIRGMGYLKAMLSSGVTFFRDLGGFKHIENDLKNAVASGEVEGPEFLSCGHALCITGGHTWWQTRQCDGRDDFVKGAREQIRAGADLIKIMATGGYSRPKMAVNHKVMPGSPQMSQEEIEAVVKEAHDRGYKVAAHCVGLEGTRRAVLAGVDSVEHGQCHDPDLPEYDELVQMMADKGTWLVPTLAAFFKDYDKQEVIKSYEAVIVSFQKALEGGVKIAMGPDTGCPFVGHGKTAMEVVHMAEAGMGAMGAIVAATVDGARLLGIDENYGSLAKGKVADFLVLKENPLDDIETLMDLDQVYKKGRSVLK